MLDVSSFDKLSTLLHKGFVDPREFFPFINRVVIRLGMPRFQKLALSSIINAPFIDFYIFRMDVMICSFCVLFYR